MGAFFTVHEHTNQTHMQRHTHAGFALSRRSGGQIHPAEEVTPPPYVTHPPSPQSPLVTQPFSLPHPHQQPEKPNIPRPMVTNTTLRHTGFIKLSNNGLVTSSLCNLTPRCSTTTLCISNHRGPLSTTLKPKTGVDL